MVFYDIIRLIDAMGLHHALTLKQDWSHAAILQLHATCFFSGDAINGNATLTWRTRHQTITITYDQWCEALGMPTRYDALYRIHSEHSEF